MFHVGRYAFKRADTDDELEQIHRLNYRTFVEEIPQYPEASGGRLVDKFHAKNTYFVALMDGQVVGMLSAHDQPPFSVAGRMSDPSLLARPGRRPLEVRLLAVEPAHRNGPVMMGLLWAALQYARDRYSDVYISGVAHRMEMYQRLGFTALGPPVASGEAEFVPMSASFPLPESVERLARRFSARLGQASERASK